MTIASGDPASKNYLDFAYKSEVSYDFGDLSDVYGTSLSRNGAYHQIGDVYLGTSAVPPDGESSGYFSTAATGDNTNGSNDETGIDLSDRNWVPNGTIQISITVVDPDGTAYLVGWFDWNNNGSFDEANEVVVFGNVTGNSTGLKTQRNLPVTLPSTFVIGQTVNARFRLYDSQPLIASPTGGVVNGEVEDYQFKGPQTTPVTLAYFSTEETTSGVKFDWSTATEVGNVGFNLYALEGGEYRQVNTELIPTQVLNSLERQDYSYEASGLSGKVF